VLRAGLELMAGRLREMEPFESKICVDTAPLLERTFARLAGLGWIGKNTCLINEPLGSWFFLGELITSLELEIDTPPPDRCGTCTRCIDACPTEALVPAGAQYTVDSRRCISYLTIELRGPIPEEHRRGIGTHVLGCDICQDVCPWNLRAPVSDAFHSTHGAADLEECSRLSEPEFKLRFQESALARPKYSGFLRNVAIAMGNSAQDQWRDPLRRLAQHADPAIAAHAEWAARQLDEPPAETIP
jgi:epoxyqueuosine reductase